MQAVKAAKIKPHPLLPAFSACVSTPSAAGPFKHSPLSPFITCPLLLPTPGQKSAILPLPETARGYGVLCTYRPECKAYLFDFSNKQTAHAFRFY